MDFLTRAKAFLLDRLYYPLIELPLFDAIMTCIIGVLGGVFPVPALTSLCTGILASVSGFSAPQTAIAIAVNLLMTPVQFILLPYFADASTAMLFVFSPSSSNYNNNGDSGDGEFKAKKPSERIVAAFASGDILAAVQSIPWIIFSACIPWLILTIIAIAVYKMFGSYERNNKRRKRSMDG